MELFDFFGLSSFPEQVKIDALDLCEGFGWVLEVWEVEGMMLLLFGGLKDLVGPLMQRVASLEKHRVRQYNECPGREESINNADQQRVHCGRGGFNAWSQGSQILQPAWG